MSKKFIVGLLFVAMITGAALISKNATFFTGAIRKKVAVSRTKTKAKKQQSKKESAAKPSAAEVSVRPILEPIAAPIAAQPPVTPLALAISETSDQAFFAAQARQLAEEHYTEQKRANEQTTSLLNDIFVTVRAIQQSLPQGIYQGPTVKEQEELKEALREKPKPAEPEAPAPPPQAEVRPEPPKLIAHYTFDEPDGSDTAVDASGNDLHGRIFNGATRIRGVLNGALQFDGVDDYVLIMTDDLLNMPAGRDFSYSLWLKKGDLARSQFILAKGSGATKDTGYSLVLGGGTQPLAELSKPDENNRLVLANDYIRDNNWHHIAVTNDRDGEAKLYADGTLIASNSIGDYNVDLSNSKNFTIGAYSTGNINFNGALDDVRLYSGILSSEAASEMYREGQRAINTAKNEPASPAPQEPTFEQLAQSLVLFYNFNEIANDRVTDLSQKGNTGLLAGSPSIVDGLKGKALLLDGVDDYIAIGNGTDLQMAKNFSVAALVKYSGTPQPTRGIPNRNWIIYKRSGNYGVQLYNPANTGQLEFTIMDDAQPIYYRATSRDNFNDDRWHLVVGTYDGQSVKLYVDGQLQGQKPAAVDVYYETPYSAVGRNANENTHHFQGTLDEFMIFNKALTEAEIRLLSP